MTDVRKGQAPGHLERREFHERFMEPYRDPAFKPEAKPLERLESIAWKAYEQGRKSPVTRKAGAGFEDPDYELSVDWLAARDRIQKAQVEWGNPRTPSRVLLVNGSPRNDGMGGRFTRARVACPLPCRFAIGLAAAIRTTRCARLATG